jgi:hypothetical protein
LKAAREVVGDGPTEAKETTLRKALRYRNGAIDAYKGKKYRKAWTLARESLALSQKVLNWGSDG